jgi:hypothetical protein
MIHSVGQIIKDNFAGDLINSALQKTKLKENIVLSTDSGYNIIEQFCSIISNSITHGLENPINSIIDVASFLRMYTNHKIATMMSNKMKNIVIIYFDDDDKTAAILDGNPVDYDVGKLKTDRNAFVIFDQKHTIGTDLSMHPLSHALITVNEKTTRSQLVQGMYRLRDINYDQTVTFVTKKKLDVVDLTKKYEDMMHENTRYKFSQQELLCKYRIAMSHDREAYKIDVFNPDIDNNVNDSIMIPGGLKHDFEKDNFVKNMRKKLDEIEKSGLNNITGIAWAQAMNDLEIMNELNSELSNVMTQQSRQISQEQNTEVNTQINISYVLTNEKDLVIKYNPTYSDIKKNNLDIRKMKVENNGIDKNFVIKLKNYVESQIGLSPSAQYLLHSKYIHSDLVIMLYYVEGFNMVLTSDDYVALYAKNYSDNSDKVKIIEYGHNQLHDLILLMYLELPGPNVLNIVKKSTKYIDMLEQNGSMQRGKTKIDTVREYFEKFYKYRLDLLYPEFYQILM